MNSVWACSRGNSGVLVFFLPFGYTVPCPPISTDGSLYSLLDAFLYRKHNKQKIPIHCFCLACFVIHYITKMQLKLTFELLVLYVENNVELDTAIVLEY